MMKVNPEELTIQGRIRLIFSATTLIPLSSLLVLAFVASTQMRRGDTTAIVLTLLVSATAVIWATLVLYRVISRKINERLLELIEVCRNYAGGDQTVRVRVSGDDLFSLLAQTLNMLLDSQELDEGEEDMRRREEYRISAQQVQVERLLHEVRVVALGDLPLQSGVTSQTLGLLADSFAYLIEGFSHAVKQIHISTIQTHTETVLMQRTTTTLDREETEELATLSHLTDEVESTANFLQQVSRNVQIGGENAESIVENAQQGKTDLHDALVEMTSIQHTISETTRTLSRLRMEANEIYEAFSQLDDVVTQADLLARNAALQATLPGGAEGQRVGILAEDIQHLVTRMESVSNHLRRLFGRLQEETQGAEGALETSLHASTLGVHKVENAGRVLSELALEAGRTVQLFRHFTHQSDEQALHFMEVAEEHARNTGQMTETHARRQEVERSIEGLTRLNEQLRLFVDSIKVPNIPFSIEAEERRSTDEASRLV